VRTVPHILENKSLKPQAKSSNFVVLRIAQTALNTSYRLMVNASSAQLENLPPPHLRLLQTSQPDAQEVPLEIQVETPQPQVHVPDAVNTRTPQVDAKHAPPNRLSEPTELEENTALPSQFAKLAKAETLAPMNVKELQTLEVTADVMSNMTESDKDVSDAKLDTSKTILIKDVKPVSTT